MRNRIVALALFVPLIGACSSSDSNDSSSAASATTPATTTAASAAPVATDAASTPSTVAASAPAESGAVGITDFKFDPPEIRVPVGGSVVWTNNDGQQHTATSSGNFDAGAIEPGASMTVAFPTAGTFAYICSFHPFMTGSVVVG
jgi:plastocyanin